MGSQTHVFVIGVFFYQKLPKLCNISIILRLNERSKVIKIWGFFLSKKMLPFGVLDICNNMFGIKNPTFKVIILRWYNLSWNMCPLQLLRSPRSAKVNIFEKRLMVMEVTQFVTIIINLSQLWVFRFIYLTCWGNLHTELQWASLRCGLH